ncbi:MAG: 50S ribosomal protein L28 [Phycisphaerales bacterium]|nr:MAG: 50S ribosomal protein L28 [Phycisphaerales bacterium]
MSRVCYFTGKKTRAGRSIARRGKAKYLGGVGRKTTGKTKRQFKPNIQRVRAVVDGRVCRIRVSAKAIRMGLVVKPSRRDWKSPEAQQVETPAPPEVVSTPAAEETDSSAE